MQPDSNKPKYIAIDGVDGGGKSTQIHMLQDYLEEKGIDVRLTREPGGTTSGTELRKLLVSTEFDLEPESELALYCIDRLEHQKKVIIPALEDNKWVISDRCEASTYAYQIAGRGLDASLLDYLSKISVIKKPDLVIIIDIDPEISLNRAMIRLKEAGNLEAEGKFEQLGTDFMKKVRRGFYEYADANLECVIIDGNDTPENVFNKITATLDKHL